MKPLLAWLFGPPRALIQAQTEIDWLRGENRRLNDLLVQAWESSRIVPVQPQHTTPPPPEPEQQETWGQMQARFAAEKVEEFEDWERDERMRLENARRINSENVN